MRNEVNELLRGANEKRVETRELESALDHFGRQHAAWILRNDLQDIEADDRSVHGIITTRE